MAINLFGRKPPEEKPAPKSKRKRKGISAEQLKKLNTAASKKLAEKIQNSITVTADDHAMTGVAMDSSLMQKLKNNNNRHAPLTQMAWFATQTFIGYSYCAIISQNWLVEKACGTPARDAARFGYDKNFDDVDEERIKEIEKADKRNNITKQLIEYEKLTRVFGQRFAMIKIKGADESYYEKPFNIDGVTKGSFEGIVQIDPCWATPLLSDRQINDPTSTDYYEPLYWMIGGKKIHRSHLLINRTAEVPDYLKPQYNYGGIPLTQKIFERVYAAEVTANEAPKLAMTKRTDYFQTDVEAAKLDTEAFVENLEMVNAFRDNFQLQVIDTEDSVIRHDTALAHLDDIIMTQYQLVAAVANVPATKLINTSPKGFNSTGEFEESSYNEELESVQKHSYEPFLDRYYQVLTKSLFGEAIEIEIAWKPLDSPKEADRAEINFKKAASAQAYFAMGAIDGDDERQRLIDDKDSGYLNLEESKDIDPLEDVNLDE